MSSVKIQGFQLIPKWLKQKGYGNLGNSLIRIRNFYSAYSLGRTLTMQVLCPTVGNYYLGKVSSVLLKVSGCRACINTANTETKKEKLWSNT